MKMLHDSVVPQKALFDLIEEITPLNNRYRDLINESSKGSDVLSVMWQVGEILEDYLKKYQIKPHALYWQIYGKAEGLKNSYITRDFLSYCLRIRRYFKDIHEISCQFPQLKRYSLFREAFPLIENPKYKLSQKDVTILIELLNSNLAISKIKNLIVKMKSQHIGIKNTRNQRLQEMQPLVDNFALIYTEIYNLIKTNELLSISNFRMVFSDALLVKLSQAVSALTQENLYVPEIGIEDKLPKSWNEFINNLNTLFQSTVENRNRFRRIVPPRKLFDLADMLNALPSDRAITAYKKRKSI